MTRKRIRTIAVGTALSVLLFAPAWASAHEAHAKAVREAAMATAPEKMSQQQPPPVTPATTKIAHGAGARARARETRSES